MIRRPVLYALLAAALFGAATPVSKMLIASVPPFQLAGLLYLGAALGVAPAAFRGGRVRLPAKTDPRNRLALLGAVAAGGVIAPVLLLFGLRTAEAASVSLWLNAEVAATALLGVLIFRDHLQVPGWVGVACTLAGAGLLSVGGGASGIAAGALVLTACVFWGLDNHLTGLIDGISASESTFWKGLVAGGVNLSIGLFLGPGIPPGQAVAAALAVGAFAYGASIVLYIMSAHAIGSTRAQIIFSSAPFFGVALSAALLGERLTLLHLGSGLLFAAGIWFLSRDAHAHMHEHSAHEHEHEHSHPDDHHDHDHARPDERLPHAHRHIHVEAEHEHTHYPDLHHRHDHG